MKGVLKEGDSRGGASHLKPINLSIFHACFSGLQALKTPSMIIAEKGKRYQKTLVILKDIRSIWMSGKG